MKSRTTATAADVRKALREERMRVDNGIVYSKRADPRALWRKVACEHVHPPKREGSPYLRVTFSHSAGTFRCLVHRLVWWAAGREIPDGAQINHRDGNKMNNCLDNLEVVSPAENMRHAEKLGLIKHTRGRGNAVNAKLTDEQVREIRERATKETQASLAAEFGITQSQISRIVHKRSYKYVH